MRKRGLRSRIISATLASIIAVSQVAINNACVFADEDNGNSSTTVVDKDSITEGVKAIESSFIFEDIIYLAIAYNGSELPTENTNLSQNCDREIFHIPYKDTEIALTKDTTLADLYDITGNDGSLKRGNLTTTSKNDDTGKVRYELDFSIVLGKCTVKKVGYSKDSDGNETPYEYKSLENYTINFTCVMPDSEKLNSMEFNSKEFNEALESEFQQTDPSLIKVIGISFPTVIPETSDDTSMTWDYLNTDIDISQYKKYSDIDYVTKLFGSNGTFRVDKNKIIEKVPESYTRFLNELKEKDYKNIFNNEELSDADKEFLESEEFLEILISDYREMLGKANLSDTKVYKDSNTTTVVRINNEKIENVHINLNRNTVPLLGDVDMDDTVTVTDIIKLQKYVLGIEALDSEQFVRADIDCNGEVDIFDLGLAKNRMLNLFIYD